MATTVSVCSWWTFGQSCWAGVCDLDTMMYQGAGRLPGCFVPLRLTTVVSYEWMVEQTRLVEWPNSASISIDFMIPLEHLLEKCWEILFINTLLSSTLIPVKDGEWRDVRTQDLDGNRVVTSPSVLLIIILMGSFNTHQVTKLRAVCKKGERLNLEWNPGI